MIPQCHSYQLDLLKRLEVTEKLMTSLASLPEHCDTQYREYNFHQVVDGVMAVLHLANNFVETTKPWTLKNSKNLSDLHRLETILRFSIEILRICGIVLQPIVPDLMDQLLNKLNVEPSERDWKNLQFKIDKLNIPRPLGDGNAILFHRIKP
jgi:methionyl-tRNA synthetase